MHDSQRQGEETPTADDLSIIKPEAQPLNNISGGTSSTNVGSVDVEPSSVDLPFMLDKAQSIEPESFPNPPRPGTNQVRATIPNVRHLLEAYGIVPRYNTISKKLTISVPGQSGAPDNADNVAMSQIISLAALNGLPSGQLPSYVAAIGDRNQFNPVAQWITSRPWDDVDRLDSLYGTLSSSEEFSVDLKKTLMYRWLLSGVAAVLKPSGFRARGVLTLQGPQGIGKTAWVNALVPNPVLREHTIKLDHHLDAGNKDSLLTAVSHWIVEIGELDSSFKKDIARLKGFLTSDRDKVRRPYGRTDSEYPRRTVFCATVNDHNFLVDSTGNSRWWTIPLTKVDYKHDIDMQQLFAQLVMDYQKGESWWLTPAEEQALEFFNKDHRAINATRERLLEVLDLNCAQERHLPAMTAMAVLLKLGIKNPTNRQCKECAEALRELLGGSKKVNGYHKWRIPFKPGVILPASPPPLDGRVF